MPSHKHTAIILKRINLGEADRIVTAFSKEAGKIRFVAKGSRRTKSKLAGSIELFCQSKLMLSDGKSLDILTSAEIVDNYLGLKPNLTELKAAAYFSEVVDKLSIDNQPNENLYSLLHRVLSSISDDDDKLNIYFLTHFFDIYGINPQYTECVRCGLKPEDNIFFSPSAGGILDEDCATYYPDSYKVDLNTVKTLNAARSTNLASFLKIKIPSDNILEARGLVSRFLKETFNKDFKSEYI
jgi:DNA repair protein RecO (recombination protein O)